jgi:hypothetical protein
MTWNAEVNVYLTRLSAISGATSSPKTGRSYAYEFADWLPFCERIGLDWRAITEVVLATDRNILASVSSIRTGRPLKRSTVNHRLGVITVLQIRAEEGLDREAAL